jgi:4-hydroxythreonine-4-phosphate dehydrogenase
MQVLNGGFDAAICMYHDQGHVPMKLNGFADAVNVTLGLPIVRTSVDHGTAFDIAYQGKASIENFLIAVEMADQLCTGKAKNKKEPTS